MNRIKKLESLIKQANSEQDAKIYLDYLWKERSEKKRLRKQEKANRKKNRKKK